MKKKLLISIGALSFAIVAIIAGATFYLMGYSLQRNGKSRGKDVYGAYMLMFERYPHLRAWTDSLKNAKALRDTFIYTTDSIKLHAMYVRAASPTPNTAVLVHGYIENAVNMLHLGHLYNHDLGYNILMPDLRYAGMSDGTHIQMGWFDRLDVMQWMDVANAVFSTDSAQTSMVVHGVSMGGATTMMVSGEKQKEYVRCFIEDCGYTSVWDEFKVQLYDQFHLPQFPLLYSANIMTKLRYGWSFSEASALLQVAKCKLPMMFIHGDNDTFVPTSMVYPIYEAKTGAKELWIVPSTGHAESYRTHPEEYRQRISLFLDKYQKQHKAYNQ
ncbi:MAG: alpha/beta hydrolase [Bacteroidaceae bacterium]|nr:alpha/beta hydrolase [Bacteroidaceae bacterium]